MTQELLLEEQNTVHYDITVDSQNVNAFEQMMTRRDTRKGKVEAIYRMLENGKCILGTFTFSRRNRK
ncbi:hypothetical protein KY326_03605, partial [Candidatus Woesearchaeota archaeon]|nr:hypothetical protein [Candidatus Woesearchaeota archaeon]